MKNQSHYCLIFEWHLAFPVFKPASGRLTSWRLLPSPAPVPRPCGPPTRKPRHKPKRSSRRSNGRSNKRNSSPSLSPKRRLKNKPPRRANQPHAQAPARCAARAGRSGAGFMGAAPRHRGREPLPAGRWQPGRAPDCQPGQSRIFLPHRAPQKHHALRCGRVVGGAWRLGGRVPAARVSQGGYAIWDAMLAWQPNPRQMRTQKQKGAKKQTPKPRLAHSPLGHHAINKGAK